jgi:hypothetical protein
MHAHFLDAQHLVETERGVHDERRGCYATKCGGTY